MNYKESRKLADEFAKEAHKLLHKYLGKGINEADLIREIEVLKILPLSEILKQHMKVSKKPMYDNS